LERLTFIFRFCLFTKNTSCTAQQSDNLSDGIGCKASQYTLAVLIVCKGTCLVILQCSRYLFELLGECL